MLFARYPVGLVFLLALPCGLNAQDLKASPGFDLTAIDRKANPCQDFYQYACGTWLANNPIPPDQASWGRFSELNERNREILRQILEAAAQAHSSDPDTQKIGDYWASCMDVAGIDAKGIAPLKPELDRIAAIANLRDLSAEIGRLQRDGVDSLFTFSSGQDFKDSNAVIGQADQGGLGLPERDYYFRQDAKAVETRKEYVAHIARMLQLLGTSQADAQKQADVIMKLETAIAKMSLDITTRRDPAAVYHKMKLSAFEGLADSFDWTLYFTEIKAPKMDDLNVAVPDFFKGQEALLKSTPSIRLEGLPDLPPDPQSGLHAAARFAEENFAFYGKYLTGAKEQKARWKRCVSFTDGDLGEALGKAYVERTFGAEGKARTLELVHNIEKAMGQDLEKLTWMTPATRKRALEKLHSVTNKIGYPDHWRDYSALSIVRGDALGNSLRSTQFEFDRQIAKIGKPVDRLEWSMTPPHRQRLLRPADEQHQLPGGHPAAALLRQKRERRHQLRRDRGRDRTRTHSRVRRPGQPVRRQREPGQLVDQSRRQSFRRARTVLREGVFELRTARRRSHERQTDAGRKYGG